MTDLDVYTDEVNCPWKHKFVVFIQSPTPENFPFFARNSNELHYWLFAFCKALDVKNGIVKLTSSTQTAYSQLLARQNRKVSAPAPVKDKTPKEKA